MRSHWAPPASFSLSFYTIHTYIHHQVPLDKLQQGSRSPAHFFFYSTDKETQWHQQQGPLMRQHSCVAALVSAITNPANPLHSHNNLHSIRYACMHAFTQICTCFNQHIDLLSRSQHIIKHLFPWIRILLSVLFHPTPPLQLGNSLHALTHRSASKLYCWINDKTNAPSSNL